MGTYIRTTLLLIVLALSGCATVHHDGARDASDSGTELRKVHLSVIRGLSDQGKPRAALAFLDDYDLRYPGDPEAEALRGEALLRIAHRDQAERIFKDLLKSGYRPAADFGLGQARAAKGDWAGAVAHFQAAARLAPTNVRYLNNFGYALLKTGKAAQAYEALARATQLDPKDAYARNNFILAATRSGRAAEAKKALGRCDPKERKRIVAFVQGWSP